MPSGSHGGSSGSHGGGGSSGGNWSGRSSGSSLSYRRTTPIHWVWHGRTYYVPVSSGSAFQGWFSAIFIVLVFAIISTLLVISGSSNINKIKTDRDYYIHMIEKAEQNENYKKEGTIKDIFYNEDCTLHMKFLIVVECLRGTHIRCTQNLKFMSLRLVRLYTLQ